MTEWRCSYRLQTVCVCACVRACVCVYVCARRGGGRGRMTHAISQCGVRAQGQLQPLSTHSVVACMSGMEPSKGREPWPSFSCTQTHKHKYSLDSTQPSTALRHTAPHMSSRGHALHILTMKAFSAAMRTQNSSESVVISVASSSRMDTTSAAAQESDSERWLHSREEYQKNVCTVREGRLSVVGRGACRCGMVGLTY